VFAHEDTRCAFLRPTRLMICCMLSRNVVLISHVSRRISVTGDVCYYVIIESWSKKYFQASGGVFGQTRRRAAERRRYIYVNYVQSQSTTKAITRHCSDEPSDPKPDKPDDWRKIQSRDEARPAANDVVYVSLTISGRFRSTISQRRRRPSPTQKVSNHIGSAED